MVGHIPLVLCSATRATLIAKIEWKPVMAFPETICLNSVGWHGNACDDSRRWDPTCAPFPNFPAGSKGKRRYTGLRLTCHGIKITRIGIGVLSNVLFDSSLFSRTSGKLFPLIANFRLKIASSLSKRLQAGVMASEAESSGLIHDKLFELWNKQKVEISFKSKGCH